MSDETVDVIVIGSGLAGLSAAFEAKTAGADVIVLEKMKITGGNSRISDGDLAVTFQMPVSAIKKTIQDYNDTIDQGKPDPFGKPVPSSTLKISSPPFYAIRLWPKVHFTPGGISINRQTQVLDIDQKPISGLYAAGEVTGGVHGSTRLGNCALTECIVFGRIAGKQASSIPH